ncbi:chemoreceptor zinc-binding protein [Maritalea mobilis]|uniref:Chemoreceptor zinc-binding protein n=1 Tax=Maritalea mobilis TaxID=483324 RepID=A0A4R6VEY5_9HYPH|nr:CZB domain-containing protein [Maritalea mobilis]TDQ61595.1 chemoreceptor zinc-binding protein [Maritalea mobilis]
MASSEILKEITKAKGAHAAWKLKLSAAIAVGKTDLDPKTVKCDNLCTFGEWLYGPSMTPEIKAGMPYKVIKRLHAEFHACASSVLDKVVAGDLDGAKRIFETDYAQISDKLMTGMSKWSRELSSELQQS